MDPFTGLTRALDYIEAHLSGELDCAAAAREAAMSPYQFQRVFGVLCGCPLGEYVRRRRLTLAGAELAAGRPRGNAARRLLGVLGMRCASMSSSATSHRSMAAAFSAFSRTRSHRPTIFISVKRVVMFFR